MNESIRKPILDLRRSNERTEAPRCPRPLKKIHRQRRRMRRAYGLIEFKIEFGSRNKQDEGEQKASVVVEQIGRVGHPDSPKFVDSERKRRQVRIDLWKAQRDGSQLGSHRERQKTQKMFHGFRAYVSTRLESARTQKIHDCPLRISEAFGAMVE